MTGASESYGHDADARLVQAKTTAGGVTVGTLAASYDAVGNLQSKTGLGGTIGYTYGSDPDQVRAVTVTGSDPGVAAGFHDL